MNKDLLDDIKNLPKDIIGYLFFEVPTLFFWIIAITLTIIIYARNN